MIKCNQADITVSGMIHDILAEYGIITTSVVMALKDETGFDDEILKRFIGDVTDSAVEAGLAGDYKKFGEALGKQTEKLKAENEKMQKRNRAIDDMIDDIFDEMFRRD